MRSFLGFVSSILALITAASANAQAVPPHAGLFIDPNVTMGDACDDQASCAREGFEYLKAIGVLDSSGSPSESRGTSKAWKATMGFATEEGQLNPGENRAVYWNDGDLGLGRDMHCIDTSDVEETSPGEYFARWTLACYVTNYRTESPSLLPFTGTPDIEASIHDSIFGRNAIATVAMERTTTARFNADEYLELRSDVSFVAFKEDDPISPGRIWIDPPLDSEGPKALPGTCIACHGGTYQGSNTPGGSRVIDANFLPFDAASFKFTSDPSLGQYSEPGQREAFRKLNAFVRGTYPPAAPIDPLIDRWYGWCGGVDRPGCYIDLAAGHFPSGGCDPNASSCGWQGGRPLSPRYKPRHLAQSVYSNVVAKYCRTCHVALPEKKNVENFSRWIEPTVKNSINIHRMPFAELPYKRYWSDPLAQNQLYYFFEPRLSGCSSACLSCGDACERTRQRCFANAHNGADRGECAGTFNECMQACPDEQQCINSCSY